MATIKDSYGNKRKKGKAHKLEEYKQIIAKAKLAIEMGLDKDGRYKEILEEALEEAYVEGKISLNRLHEIYEAESEGRLIIDKKLTAAMCAGADAIERRTIPDNYVLRIDGARVKTPRSALNKLKGDK